MNHAIKGFEFKLEKLNAKEFSYVRADTASRLVPEAVQDVHETCPGLSEPGYRPDLLQISALL